MSPARYAKLVEALHRAEADMLRTIHRWEKLRGQVRRAEKTLDRDFAKRGEGDVRELMGEDIPGPRTASGPDYDDPLPVSL